MSFLRTMQMGLGGGLFPSSSNSDSKDLVLLSTKTIMPVLIIAAKTLRHFILWTFGPVSESPRPFAQHFHYQKHTNSENPPSRRSICQTVQTILNQLLWAEVARGFVTKLTLYEDETGKLPT